MKDFFIMIVLVALCSLPSSSANILWGNSNILGANVNTGDLYGFSVSLYKNLAVVGAPGALGGMGKAFLFVNPGSWKGLNNTNSGQLFVSPNTNSIDKFGTSVVALSRNFLVVSPGNARPQAFLYYIPPTVPGLSNWTYYTVLCSATQDVSGYGDWGRSIVLRDTPALAILVGAQPITFNHEGGYAVPNAGMVDDVYSTTINWEAEAAHRVYSPGNPQQNFGWTVDWDLTNPLSIVVACQGSFTVGVAPSIMVSWSWNPFANIYSFDTTIEIPASLTYDSGFGYSLKLYSNANQIRTIIVGAPNATGPNGKNYGVALIYSQTTNTSSFGGPVMLYSPDPHAGDLFGTSVAIYGNLALVGAPGYANKGVVFVFSQLLNGTWTYLRSISPSLSTNGFGASVSLSANSGSGMWAVIGAPNGGSGTAYLGQVECSTTQYGISCSPCLCSVNGTCDYGINGTGLCLTCSPNYWGPTCSNQCTCNSSKPICNSGPTGDGTCNCASGFWGPSCNQTCSCMNGTCNSETGKCLSCFAGFWGPLCVPCTCVNGLCNSGISGDGNCVSCTGNWYGTNCDKQCSCVNGTCNNNPPASAPGDCSTCFSERNGISYYGSNCNQLCTCKFGVCDMTSGQCTSCMTSFFGSTCAKNCSCLYGTCNDGLTGNGQCSSCNTNNPYGSNNYGPNCYPCTCDNGQCNDGLSGDGTCSNCDGNWELPNCDSCSANWTGTNCSLCVRNQWGPDCSNKCTCVNGECNSGTTGNGMCSQCSIGYYDSNCNSSCSRCSSKDCYDGIYGSGNCICPGNLPNLLPDGVTCSNKPAVVPMPIPMSAPPIQTPIPPKTMNPPALTPSSGSDMLVSVIVVIAMVGLLLLR